MKTLRLMAASVWSPGAAFTEIRETNARPWLAIIVHVVVGIAVAGVLVSRIDFAAAILAQAAQQGNPVPQEQQEAMTALFSSPVITFVISALPAIFVPLMFLLIAAIYFGMFLIFGSTTRYSQYLSLVTYAYTPQIFNSFVLIALLLVSRPTSMDPSMLGGVSPAIFITLEPGTGSPGPLFVLASSLNLFTLWVLVLLVVAFRGLVSRRTSMLSITIAVLIPWLVYVGVRVGWAALFA